MIGLQEIGRMGKYILLERDGGRKKVILWLKKISEYMKIILRNEKII